MPPTRSHSSPSSGLTLERRDRRAQLLGTVGADAHQLIHADRQQAAPLHLLKQAVLLDGSARVANARQARGVQLPVLFDERLNGERRRRRQLHERLGAIDELAVQLALGVARDASSGELRRVLRDVPLLERGGVEDVLVSAAHDDDRVDGRHGVEIAAVRQAVFLELRLVPVAVGGDHLAGTGLLDARGDRRQQVVHRPDAGEIDAGAAARVVQVIVRKAGNDGLAAQVDRRRRRAGQFPDRCISADGGEPPARDRDGLARSRIAASTVMMWPLTRIVSAGIGACAAPMTAKRRHAETQM